MKAVPLEIWIVVVLCIVQCCHVTGEAHPHVGKVTPFQAGDPGVKLNGDALRILQTGQPYKTQIQSGTAGRGMVVQDVHAPTNLVWDRILDFNAYSTMVPKTIESQIYRREVLKHGIQRIWVRMKIGFPVLKLQFYVQHWYDPAKHSLTWTLDYTTKSDLDDSVGYWYVIPHPDNPTQWSRVYYSVEVSMFSWVPQFVVDFMSKQALVDATAWVKKYSELEASKLGFSATAAATTATGKEQRKQPWWIWGRQRTRTTSSYAAKTTAVGVSPASAAATEVREQPYQLGLTRYVLVSTVLALSLYNVHLYFSQ